MSMKRNITIDGQEVLLRPLPLSLGSTGCGSTGIFIKTCGIWKRDR